MRLPWRKTNSTAACWGRRVRPPCGLRVGVASDSEGSGTVRRTAWRDIFMMGDVVSDGVRGVPIATEKTTTIFTRTDVQRVGGAAAGGSGDMDNIILGTSLACAAGVAAAFRADLRALRARERAMRQGAELSWGPNGHELRVVLPRLRSAEITAIESGRIEAALLVEPPVLFLLIRFREQTDRVALSLVCSCCWWGSSEERTDPPASEVVRFVLVEGQSGIVAQSEHPTSLWNSSGRCTVPSMSRHGLVTILRTKSRLRRWFASTRPINCGIAARCDAAHKKSLLEPRVRAGSGSTQATDEAALSYRAWTRGGGRRGGLTRRGTPNRVKEITPFSVQVYTPCPRSWFVDGE